MIQGKAPGALGRRGISAGSKPELGDEFCQGSVPRTAQSRLFCRVPALRREKGTDLGVPMEISAGIISWSYQLELSDRVFSWSYQVELSTGIINWSDQLELSNGIMIWNSSLQLQGHQQQKEQVQSSTWSCSQGWSWAGRAENAQLEKGRVQGELPAHSRV